MLTASVFGHATNALDRRSQWWNAMRHTIEQTRKEGNIRGKCDAPPGDEDPAGQNRQDQTRDAQRHQAPAGELPPQFPTAKLGGRVLRWPLLRRVRIVVKTVHDRIIQALDSRQISSTDFVALIPSDSICMVGENQRFGLASKCLSLKQYGGVEVVPDDPIMLHSSMEPTYGALVALTRFRRVTKSRICHRLDEPESPPIFAQLRTF
jgi:hypothetical protein